MRYRSYTQRDEQATPEGDTAFTALNCKLDPPLLPEGTLSESVNKRLRRGIAETRGGIVTPIHFNAFPMQVYGSGLYSDPNSDEEWMLLATDAGVYRLRDGHYPELIPLPNGERIDGECEFVQAQYKILLFRGEVEAPLEWNGLSSGRFKFIDQSDAGDGTQAIPTASTAELFANRLFVPFGRDEIAVSDILDYTRYDPVLNQFKINSGTDERVVRLMPFTAQSMIVFKTRSTWALESIAGDLSAVSLATVSRSIGCCARKTAVMIGGEVLFLSESPKGVYRLQQTVYQRVQILPVPISDPIEPLIKRINWKFASRAAAVLFDEYYFLAVPLDDSTRNNAVLVLNTVTGSWESLDTFPNVSPVLPPVDLPDFDFLVIRYLWEDANGTDLDTRTSIEGVDASINGVDLGFCHSLRDGYGPTLGPTPAYMTWASDNLTSGVESVMVNFTKLHLDFPTVATATVRLAANWYQEKRDGAVRIELTTYRGGVMSQSGYDFVNSGGVLVSTLTLNRNVTTFDNTCGFVDDLGSFTYNFAAHGGVIGDAGPTPPAPQPISIDDFRITQFDGKQRLFGVDHSNGRVYLFGEGKTDRIGEDEHAIEDRMTTRGYTMQDPAGKKRATGVNVAIGTWNPSFTVTLNHDGVRGSETLANARTRDRTKTFRFAAPTHDATNAGDDHNAPRREDYSVACPIKLGSGVALNLEQENIERFPARALGRWASVTIASSRGSIGVRTLEIEGIETLRAPRGEA